MKKSPAIAKTQEAVGATRSLPTTRRSGVADYKGGSASAPAASPVSMTVANPPPIIRPLIRQGTDDSGWETVSATSTSAGDDRGTTVNSDGWETVSATTERCASISDIDTSESFATSSDEFADSDNTCSVTSDSTVDLNKDSAALAVQRLLEGGWGSIADLDDISPAETEDNAVVVGFRDGSRLMPHQVTGRLWMRRQEAAKGRMGGILADAQGLGKTVAMLALIVDDKTLHGNVGQTLIVCPAGLIGQWVSEVKCYTGQTLQVLEHKGATRVSDGSGFRRANVVVTSYKTVTSEYKAFVESLEPDYRPPVRGTRFALFQLRWRRITLDEAHRIKDHSIKAAKACFSLEANFRWCMTGTPIQNSIDELYSYIKFLRVEPMNNWDTFNRQVSNPLKAGKKTKRSWERLHVVLRALMLRRNKDSVDLPGRKIQVETCHFTPTERVSYDRLEARLCEDVANALDGNRFAAVLVALLRLRQACCHPAIAAHEKDIASNPVSDERDITYICDTIIFSQFLPMLDRIEILLAAEGITYVRYDGRMSQARQQESLRQIRDNSDVKCIVVSFKAGGLGLNLTACNNVILMDPWWNPALEDQAFDRAHRIGQTRTVHVYKLVVDRTIEQRVLRLQEQKRQLARNVLTPNTNTLKKMPKADILKLFSSN
ncbi:hypothetical protein BV25DRAFT_1921532 [Artomyces pyxidatus]|uniref:Uncharacterized protein n=1 Tax=Artomyces pyxidatus TaxID=48021 RepID=A0ACB8SH83_9AGAM|nr:hypothetical protein BV25DRAFT_1921532 [Artomyces pyxidatus]